MNKEEFCFVSPLDPLDGGENALCKGGGMKREEVDKIDELRRGSFECGNLMRFKLSKDQQSALLPDNFADALERLVDQYYDKGLSGAVIIGVLECVKLRFYDYSKVKEEI